MHTKSMRGNKRITTEHFCLDLIFSQHLVSTGTRAAWSQFTPACDLMSNWQRFFDNGIHQLHHKQMLLFSSTTQVSLNVALSLLSPATYDKAPQNDSGEEDTAGSWEGFFKRDSSVEGMWDKTQPSWHGNVTSQLHRAERNMSTIQQSKRRLDHFTTKQKLKKKWNLPERQVMSYFTFGILLPEFSTSTRECVNNSEDTGQQHLVYTSITLLCHLVNNNSWLPVPTWLQSVGLSVSAHDMSHTVCHLA